MQYQQFALEMEMTGITRKQASEVLSKVLNRPYVYNNTADIYITMDTFDRQWILERASGILSQKNSGDRIVGANDLYAIKLVTPLIYQRDFDTMSVVLNGLHNTGAIVNDTTKLSVNVSAKKHTEKSLQNLANMMESKGELIFKSVQSRNTQQPTKTNFHNEAVICFSMFNSSLSTNTVKSYVQLATAMNHLSVTQNNISPKKNESPNEKFTFRTWLIRLGMIGSEFKTTRSELLENLVGNTAWKNPERALQHREPVQPSESLQSEITQDSLPIKLTDTLQNCNDEQSMAFGSM